MIESSKPSFFGKPWLVNLIVILIFLLGFGIRALDLTDLPLDFNPTRQLLSAIKARGMYYQIARNVPEEQREIAVRQWKEAPVLDGGGCIEYWRGVGGDESRHLYIFR